MDQEVTVIETLFLRHTNMLRGFIHGLVPDREAVEDVLHDTFVTVRSKAAEFAMGSNFSAWARAIARIKTLEHLRRNRRWPTAIAEDTMELLADSGDVLDDWEERMTALRDCVGQLPPARVSWFADATPIRSRLSPSSPISSASPPAA